MTRNMTGRQRRTDHPSYAAFVLRNIVEQDLARSVPVATIMATRHVSYDYVYELKHQLDPGRSRRRPVRDPRGETA